MNTYFFILWLSIPDYSFLIFLINCYNLKQDFSIILLKPYMTMLSKMFWSVIDSVSIATSVHVKITEMPIPK